MGHDIEEQKLEIFRLAVELLEVNGHEAELREEYSGRGMYGKAVPAITIDGGSGMLLGWAVTCAAINLEHEAEDVEMILPQRSDSMGLGMVYY